MLRRFSTILILSLLLFAFLAMTAFAAKSPVENNRVKNLKVDQSILYSFPNEYDFNFGSADRVDLGSTSFDKDPGHGSPGIKIGDTWYDYQHNGSMGRMIGWGPHSGVTGDAIVHMSWMYLPGDALVSRKYAYTFYKSETGEFGTVTEIQPDDDYAGYAAIDVTADNRGVVGGHNNEGSGYSTQIYWDFTPGLGFFQSARVPDDIQAYYQADGFGTECIWPKFRYQEGTLNVTHIFAQISEENAADPQALYYFRKVGTNEAGTWDNPPYCVDTVFDISQDVACSQNGDKVALIWTGNLPNAGDCDTCSGESDVHVQWDNDLYYQISDDQGASWSPRVNLTQNVNGVAGFRPYDDMSALMDASDNLHIIWSAVIWPADPVTDGWGWDCRLFHWSENNPYIRTVANADYTQDECTPGAWNINIAKMSVSECDGKIYALWVQFNEAGRLDDCAARADGGQGDVSGAVNGDLWVSVSSDGGLTWDVARNVTHSYSPGCDPANGGTPCASDNWPSMTRYGRQNLAGEDWSLAEVVVPGDVSWSGDYYLDVQYILDIDAGGIVQDEGTWQLADVNWFRMACVEPIPNPQFVPSWRKIADPAWTKPGTQLDTALVIENTGNVNLNYTLTVQEVTAPSGWLAVTGNSGVVPSGINNTEELTVHLNNGGIYNGTGTELIGRLIFDHNAPTDKDTLNINFFVVDTLVKPVWDTLYAYSVGLTVGRNGNYGRQGAGKVNLDWYNDPSECDTLARAEVYLYDASPLVGWITPADDTLFYWSIFDDGYLDSLGWRPVAEGGMLDVTECAPGILIYQSGTFVTQDSTVAAEKTWIAAKDDATNNDFIIQRLSVWSYDGAAHNGLIIGEAVDWDVPSDSGSENTGGFDFSRNLIYQRGAEYNQDDTIECQNNDTRFGGLAFIQSYLNGTSRQTVPYSGYIAENDSFVYPAGGFVPSQLYDNMQVSGFSTVDSTEDLHMVMCFEPNFDLGASDRYEAYSVLGSVQSGTSANLGAVIDKAKTWFTAHGIRALLADGDGNGIADACEGCCVGDRGNIDGDPGDNVDISDLVFLVNYSFGGGAEPPCLEEADVDGSGGVDISDLVYMVNYSFGGGAAPVGC